MTGDYTGQTEGIPEPHIPLIEKTKEFTTAATGRKRERESSEETTEVQSKQTTIKYRSQAAMFLS